MPTWVLFTFLQDQASRDARQAEEAKRVDDPSAKLLIPLFKILPPRARSVSPSLHPASLPAARVFSCYARQGGRWRLWEGIPCGAPPVSGCTN